MASCTAPSQGSVPDPTALIGSAAPPATGRNLTGRGTLSLAELLGKPTAVVFWLNTCPHCRKALPQVNRLKSTLENGQVVTAAIDAHQRGPKGFETPSAAVKTLHLRLPTILVANDGAHTQWRVASTPTAYIIDSSGKITQVLQNADNLAQSIKDALAQTN
jgi:thiol-disulfide isomerase/thioredoxin